MNILELMMLGVFIVFVVIVPIFIAFILNLSRQQTKLILGIYLLVISFFLVGLLTIFNLI